MPVGDDAALSPIDQTSSNMWTTLLLYLAIVIYAVLVLSTATVVLLENRQPSKTIAWVVVLVMMPVVGLVLFYFFGQNIRKERYISRRQYTMLTSRLLKVVRHLPPEAAPERYIPLTRLFEHTNSAVLTACRGVAAYGTGADWLIALLKEIGTATSTVHIEMYIFEDDAVGRLVRDALVDKARQGVKVRLLYDDVGCWDVSNSFFSGMRDEGIEVAAFLPVRFPQLTHKVNYRNHRKLCIIDSRVGFIGGMNFALRYVSRRQPFWRDQFIRLEGGSVADMQRLFLTDWCFVTADKKILADTPLLTATTDAAALTGNGCVVQIVPSNPVSRYPEIMYGLTWVFQHARRYLYIQTPYFLPTDSVMQALVTAAMSGVDVRLMVPRRPDGFWLRWGNDSYFSTVLQAGIRVFTYRKGFLHSKCAVADDDWCTVGSSNMDFRSFENNFEANAFIYGRAAALAFRRMFMTDLRDCDEVTLDTWRHRPYYRRLLEAFTRILAPLL